MTDKQLAGFLAIAEQGSFTAAADSLYISQSALSQQIAQLEHHLGFALFDRRSRQASLTEAGKAFQEKASQILSLYYTGRAEGKYLEKLAKNQTKRLVVACEGDQFLHIWMGLFLITKEIAQKYAPQAVRYDSRERLYLALQRGEADIAVQLDNPDIQRYGLLSVPFARTPELCLFIPGTTAPLVEGHGPLTPEDLKSYAVAFHNEPGISCYEDELRDHFAAQFPRTQTLNPIDFFSAGSVPTVLLVPAIQHTPHLQEYVHPLDWGDGATACFVISPKCDERAMDYAQYIKEHITQEICPWYRPLPDGDA